MGVSSLLGLSQVITLGSRRFNSLITELLSTFVERTKKEGRKIDSLFHLPAGSYRIGSQQMMGSCVWYRKKR